FVVNDFEGNSVACSVTLLAPMGTGQMIANSGIVTAPAPPPSGVISMVPVLVTTSGKGGRATLALAAAGGAAAPSVAAATIAAIVGGQAAEAAISQPRQFAGGGGVALEPEAGESAEALKTVGHTLLPPASIGRTNLIACPDGAIDRCAYLADPRGSGLAARRSAILQ